MPGTAKAPKKQAPVIPETPENFRVVDYEGLDLLLCTVPKCGFDTFDIGSARSHATTHEKEPTDDA